MSDLSGRAKSGRKRLTKGQKEYLAKLRDPRWQKRKSEVLARDGFTCSWCGAGVNHGRNLQVHHGYYDRALERPEDYPDESLFTLCERCHEQAEVVRQQVYEALGCLHPKYHHHIYYTLMELLERLQGGEKFDELAVPWAVTENL